MWGPPAGMGTGGGAGRGGNGRGGREQGGERRHGGARAGHFAAFLKHSAVRDGQGRRSGGRGGNGWRSRARAGEVGVAAHGWQSLCGERHGVTWRGCGARRLTVVGARVVDVEGTDRKGEACESGAGVECGGLVSRCYKAAGVGGLGRVMLPVGHGCKLGRQGRLLWLWHEVWRQAGRLRNCA